MSFDENVDKNMNKSLSGNYSQKSLDHAKQSAADALKTARAIQKNIYICIYICIPGKKGANYWSAWNNRWNNDNGMSKKYINLKQSVEINDDTPGT